MAYGHRYLIKRKLEIAYHAAARTVRTIFTRPAPCLDPSSTLSRAALPRPPACPKHMWRAQQMLIAVPGRRETWRQRIYSLSRRDLPQNIPRLHNSHRYLYREIFYTKGSPYSLRTALTVVTLHRVSKHLSGVFLGCSCVGGTLVFVIQWLYTIHAMQPRDCTVVT